jgi:hypothetical protein
MWNCLTSISFVHTDGRWSYSYTLGTYFTLPQKYVGTLSTQNSRVGCLPAHEFFHRSIWDEWPRSSQPSPSTTWLLRTSRGPALPNPGDVVIFSNTGEFSRPTLVPTVISPPSGQWRPRHRASAARHLSRLASSIGLPPCPAAMSCPRNPNSLTLETRNPNRTSVARRRWTKKVLMGEQNSCASSLRNTQVIVSFPPKGCYSALVFSISKK